VMRAFTLQICVVLVIAASAKAGIITAIGAASGPGLGSEGTFFFFTNSANNDNSPNAAGENAVGFDETIFDFAAYMDIAFEVVDSGGTTEYSMFDSTFNFSAPTWIGFQLELGFGTGSAFERAGATSGLDFDFPDQDPTPSSSIFPSVTHTADLIVYDGDTMPFGFVDAIFWSVDVPDDISSFTLRRTPIVPEPGTGLLTCVGLFLFAHRTSRFRRADIHGRAIG